MVQQNSNDGRLFVLDGKQGIIFSIAPDGSDRQVILSNLKGTPDGIALDPDRGHLYWTNMGEHWDQNDGSIERIDLDGSNRTMIIPPGGTFTPKQLQLHLPAGRLYWCDREGMRVMSSRLDGTGVITLVQTGATDADRKDETRHCVGITLDIDNGHLYWTQKGPSNAGKGRILRAGLELPSDADPAAREDIEILWDRLPEPIDLELNPITGQLYWTDRGDPPAGNTLNRASIHRQIPPEPEILCDGLKEAIGLALDIENDRVFFGDLGGNLYCCDLNGSHRRTLYTAKGPGEMFTGIAYLAAPPLINKTKR